MKKLFLLFFLLLFMTVIFAQPANDNCTGATSVNPNGTCYPGTTVGANDSWTGTVGCQSGNNHPDVWFSFVATGTSLNINVTAGTLTGDIEFVLVASTGPCAGLTNAGSLCGPSPLTGTINGIQIGITYYYTISSSSSSQGTFTTCVNNTTPPPVPGQDCNTSATLCNANSFPQGTFTGVGVPENIMTNSCFGGNERQSKWYKFTVGCAGTLGFVINPTNSSDDYDWAIWNTSVSPCASTMPGPVACNWSGCPGATGLSPNPAAEPNVISCGGPPGPCGSGTYPKAFCNESSGNSNLLNVTAGTTYTILIDNYTANGNGFNFSFRGTATIGPNANFTVTPGTCGIYNFTKTCQTTNSTFLWQFGDGTTSTAQNPVHTYTTFGNFNVTLQVTDALGCVATFSQPVNIAATPLPTVTTPVTYCVGAAASPLTATGTNLLWYTVPIGGVGSSTAPTPSTAAPGTTSYYVSQTIAGCESQRAQIDVIVTTTVLPIAPSPQTFCSNTNPTVANLSATGTGLQWYNVSTGGSPLAGTTVLVSGTYYVSQTVSGCESGRTPVTVTINTTALPTAPSPQTFCSNTNPSVANLTATGTGLLWYNVSTGGSPLAGTTALVSGTYYVSQTVSGCESGRAPVTVTINTTALPTAPSPQTFCSNTNPTIANLSATGTGLQWYNVSIGGSPLAGTTALISGTYYVSQTVSGCESGRTPVTVTINTTALPTAPSPQTFCGNTNPTVLSLTATGSGLLWYNVPTGGSPLAGTTVLVSGTYYVSQTAGGCESGRTPVTVTINTTALPTAPSPQTFCSNINPAVSSLTATGSGLQWYNVPTGGSPLAGITALASGTYYVSQTVGGCESGRTPVTVTINTTALPTAPSPQTFCSNINPTVSSLTATGSGLLWYNVSTGGSPLAGTTALVPGTYYVSQTVSGCESGRIPVIVAITSISALVSVVATSTSICSGGSITFTALPTNGGSNPIYQWMINGVSVPGQTSSTFTASAFANGDAVSVSMISNDPCANPATATSNPITITTTSVIASVSITASNTTICNGGSVTFTASPVNGGSNPTYQWMINGVNVPGQTASGFSTSTLTNGNTVSVMMNSNDPCANPTTATSNPISITITSVTPSVSITASNTTICNGGSVTFTAAPTNSGPNPAYQWMINGVNVPGQTASNFTTSALTNGNTVSVMMTSNDPCANPATATSNPITITTTAVTPSVSITASSTSICSGGSVTFTAVSINGGPNPTYQWMINGVNISGQTASSFTTSTLNNGNVVSVMMNSNDPCANPTTVISNPITITTTSLTPSVSITASSTSICSGSSVTFTAAPVNGGSNPAYQWMINGVNVPGQTASSFTTSTLGNGNVVSVTMTSNDPCANPPTATSNSIAITQVSVPPSVSITASSTSICSGSSVTFTATPVNGGSNPTYQWMINGVNVPGQTGSGFTTSTLSNGNVVSVVMNSNDPCANPVTATSNSITITAISLTPSVSVTASSTSICNGGSVTFTAVPVNGGTNPTYQWMINGVNVPGQTASAFTSSTLNNGNTVSVMMASNEPCANPATATSNPITISTISVTPSVSIIASNTSICSGGTVTFITNAIDGGTAPTYQWMINGIPVPGQTGTAFTSSSLNNGDQVSVAMTSNFPCADPATVNSNAITITTTSVIPSVSIAASNTSICSGVSVTFTATATNGGSAPAYQWMINGVNVAGQTTSVFTSSTLSNGNTISVMMTSNAPCASPVATVQSQSLTVTVNTAPLVMITNPPSVCEPAFVDLTAPAVTAGSDPGLIYTYWLDANATAPLSNPNAVAIAGTYYIKGQAATGCFTIKPVLVSIDQQLTGIRYPTVSAGMNMPAQLSARNPGTGYTYSWSPATALDLPNIKDPVFTNSTGLEYLITITSPAGCVVVDTLLVVITRDVPGLAPNLFVPKAWTPNGDGHNDYLFPITVNITELKYFRIYNRWGQKVFETNIIGNGWDGNYNNKPQPTEVYTWILEATGMDGKTIKRSGNAVLIR